MGYQLYDIAGIEIEHHDLQDKGVWCQQGESQESGFISRYGECLGLTLNPAKKDDTYAPDLMDRASGRLADLKTQNTPFFQAHSRFGLDPQTAVVFNVKDRKRYAEYYPDIDIYFAVDWQVVRFVAKDTIRVAPMLGVWTVPFRTLHDWLDTAPVHSYYQRRNDTGGNARGSHVIDLADPRMKRLL